MHFAVANAVPWSPLKCGLNCAWAALELYQSARRIRRLDWRIDDAALIRDAAANERRFTRRLHGAAQPGCQEQHQDKVGAFHDHALPRRPVRLVTLQAGGQKRTLFTSRRPLLAGWRGRPFRRKNPVPGLRERLAPASPAPAAGVQRRHDRSSGCRRGRHPGWRKRRWQR